MSLTRQLLHEFRPLFRILEQPLTRSPAIGFSGSRSLFDDPFFGFETPTFSRPAVDVIEEGNQYKLEADLPGVKKENIEVRIGEDGRSITIEGKIQSRKTPEGEVTKGENSQQLSAERAFAGNRTFTRTVWLPRPIDSNSVEARLSDGVLSITVPKAVDKASVTVPIN